MTALTVTRGLPASGKSSWARQWQAEKPDRRARVCRDDLRRDLFGRTGGETTSVQEDAITAVETAAVVALLAAGLDVVVDATNLRPEYITRWVGVATDQGATLKVKDFTDVSPATCIDRDAHRPAGERVGAAVILRMAVDHLRMTLDYDWREQS